MNAVDELVKVLGEIGARVTFDPERTIANPCCICGTMKKYRDLVEIGRYPRAIGGHSIGWRIMRPACADCAVLITNISWLPLLAVNLAIAGQLEQLARRGAP